MQSAKSIGGLRALRFVSGAVVAAVLALAFLADSNSGPVAEDVSMLDWTKGVHGFGPIEVEPTKFITLGTQKDCELRTKKNEYCSDLFLAMKDIDDFWKAAFAKTVTGGQKLTYSAPKRFVYYYPNVPIDDVDCSNDATPGEYCTPAFYSTLNVGIALNEPLMISFHEDYGDVGALVVLAHEWGHHIQNLRGILDEDETAEGEDRFTIQTELQADCYAGMWVSHTEGAGYTDEGDIDEAIDAAFSGGDLLDWTDISAHGRSEQRVLAFRSGYVFENAEICAYWEGYAGEPVLDLTRYALALFPQMEVLQTTPSGSRVIAITDTGNGAAVKTLRNLPTTAASAQLAGLARTELAANTRLLEEVELDYQPDVGLSTFKELDASTQSARRYEEPVVNGKQHHGLIYMHVRPSGAGFAIVVTQEGPAAQADWDSLETDLLVLVLGLSLR